MEEIRINQYLSKCGICSRREADRAIEEGRVYVNGSPAAAGMKVTAEDLLVFDGKQVTGKQETVVLAVNKPIGVVCTTASFKGEKNIVDLVNFKSRVYPVGRLDKASEGLILMTNDGELAEKISRGANGHEKEYRVRIDRKVTAEFTAAMSAGVDIQLTEKKNGAEFTRTVRTRPCKVTKVSADTFDIVLTQGLNRQIRRMCEALGCRVRSLLRVRVMNISLGDLKSGEYRILTKEELTELKMLTEAKM